MKKSAIAILLVLTAATVSAETTVIARVDMKEGSKPFKTFMLITPQIEFYDFGGVDYEVGRLWKVGQQGKHVQLAGAYVAYLPDAKQVFILPWLHVHGAALGGSYSANISDYVPLNGGEHFVFGDDCNLMWDVRRVKIGASAKFAIPQHGQADFGIGPKLSVQLNKHLSGSTRVVFMRHGGAIARVEPAGTF